MKKTEWHRQVTVRIDSFTTITLSDEMGCLGTFIDEKLSKVKNVFDALELLIELLQENLEYHKKEMLSIFHKGKTDEEYSEGLRKIAKLYDVYVEGEV